MLGIGCTSAIPAQKESAAALQAAKESGGDRLEACMMVDNRLEHG
jgi:hypothetical protein